MVLENRNQIDRGTWYNDGRRNRIEVQDERTTSYAERTFQTGEDQAYGVKEPHRHACHDHHHGKF
jgi:hypothetical protein